MCTYVYLCEYMSVCWTLGFCVRVYTFVNM